MLTRTVSSAGTRTRPYSPESPVSRSDSHDAHRPGPGRVGEVTGRLSGGSALNRKPGPGMICAAPTAHAHHRQDLQAQNGGHPPSYADAAAVVTKLVGATRSPR
ncbi:hypothetical protein ABTX85_37600 [Streptomyces sp. NPDC096097]|uniref:hypothetical protein n=1 Tax=Streptomyces sp. NPDC096097 TaxID=3155546 RepID=UPI0033264761